MSKWRAFGLMLAVLAWPTLGLADNASHDQRLPAIGPAPDFTLTSQDGVRVSLRDFRGKVVAVTFIYTLCTDLCPMLTANMSRVQAMLGAAFGPKVEFISITVDPERDTPEVLKRYAEGFDANPQGWVFLTGDPAIVREVGRNYGVFAKKTAVGEVDHTFLTPGWYLARTISRCSV